MAAHSDSPVFRYCGCRNNSCRIRSFLAVLTLLALCAQISAQESPGKEISCMLLTEPLKLDGALDERDWSRAAEFAGLTMIEPRESARPTFYTTVKILADRKNLYIGVICYDENPGQIVSFSKARDSELLNEDNIKFILDTYGDGRNGYIFSINPYAARYDALVAQAGEKENPSWDGAWDARAMRNADSWSAEIRIPVSTLSFKKGLREWGFNIERRIQRLLEVDRWSAVSRDYQIGQTIHAGRITDLPEFDLGIGLTPRASVLAKATHEAGQNTLLDWQPSLDLMQRIGSNISAQLTCNTDFAETEVDSRQMNLTRFPLQYPEKRQFFLEGSDIYEFGLDNDMIPFYSRRVGLYEGNEVPILVGGKLNGKINKTQFGGLVTHTAAVDTLVPRTTLGTVRIKQNVLKESTLGMITSFGDPGGQSGAMTTGMDFTFQTSTFRGNKNFLIGIWGLLNDRADLNGDKTAVGLKIDYPNDLWDGFVIYQRVGDAFDPSLGFTARNDFVLYRTKIEYMPRPDSRIVRQFSFRMMGAFYTDLNRQWESYELSLSPFHALFESGDRIEITLNPTGEYLKNDFEISEGIFIGPGPYHWMRYNLEAETASKRPVNATGTLGFGGFYGGHLSQLILALNWRLMSFLNLEFSYENNMGRLPSGNFTKELLACRIAFNLSSDLNLSSLVQYDNESGSIGSYSRLRWTFAPLGDLYVVFKHNIQQSVTERWNYDSSQLVLKLTYGLAL